VIERRLFLGSIGAAALVGLGGRADAALGSFVMWHSPGCGCCLEWAKRVEKAFGRKLPIIEAADMAQVKRAQRVPEALRSCHTALIGGYAIEGHVPPADIRRLIASKSKSVRGLAVPGMPLGSPGMDVGHDEKQPYQVIAFAADGRRFVFARHT
jgi:hypothetical protein